MKGDSKRFNVYIEKEYSFVADVVNWETGEEESNEYAVYLDDEYNDLKVAIMNKIETIEAKVIRVYHLKFERYVLW